MINLSIKPSAVPSVWKIEKITPVFKSGDSIKPENHRPISGLPIASKILEKTVHNNLITFLENKHRLTDCQTANNCKSVELRVRNWYGLLTICLEDLKLLL